MGDQFRHIPVAVLALAVLTACQVGNRSVLITEPEMHLASQPDACGAADLAEMQGQSFTALAGRRLSGDLRVIRWSEAVTAEIDPRRINAMVDERGMVLKLFCG